MTWPPTVPASTCPHCSRPGHVSPQQTNALRQPLADQRLRFDCDCGHTWTTNTEHAHAHGRFLDRAHLRP